MTGRQKSRDPRSRLPQAFPSPSTKGTKDAPCPRRRPDTQLGGQMAFLHGQRVGGPSQQLPAGTRLSWDARRCAPTSRSPGQISVLRPSSSELRRCKPGVYVDPNLLGGAGWLWVNIWLISRHRELFLLSQCLWCRE